MGARRNGQGGNPQKCCEVFCALVFVVKRSVDQLFMHYFHNFVDFWEPPPGLHPWTSMGDFRFQTPDLPTPEKYPAGAHG